MLHLQPLSTILAQASVLGFSGSRAPSPASVQAASWALQQVASSAHIVVGCAAGIDAVARAAVAPSQCTVVHASQFGQGRGAFAARSIACVRQVAAQSSRALWVAFPSTVCPVGLYPHTSPSRCFAGYGSGTWASLACALGQQLPALIYLPASVAPPSGWPLRVVQGTRSWWHYQPISTQPSLF